MLKDDRKVDDDNDKSNTNNNKNKNNNIINDAK